MGSISNTSIRSGAAALWLATGFHHSELWQRDFPRIQILTVEDLLAGKRPEIPGPMSPYAQASRIGTPEGRRLGLEG